MGIAKALRSKGFICCAHITTQTNYDKMLDTIDTPYDRHRNGVQADGVYSYTRHCFNEPYIVVPGDFPGVYMELVYDMQVLYKNMAKYAGTVVIIFPLSILQSGNHWYFNLCDRCGVIGYDTYFHDTIQQVPNVSDILAYYKKEYYNEIVFHQSVSLALADEVITSSGIQSIKLQSGQSRQSGKSRQSRPANYIFYSDCGYNGRAVPYYHQPSVCTTSDQFYIDFTRNHLPDEYKHLCDGVTTKCKMEEVLRCCKIGHMDLITYLHVNEQTE